MIKDPGTLTPRPVIGESIPRPGSVGSGLGTETFLQEQVIMVLNSGKT